MTVRPALAAACLTVVVLGAPAAARATTVGSPTLTLSSRAAGATHVRYRVRFIATSALPGGNAGQITLTAPTGTQLSAARTDYAVTDLSTAASGTPGTATASGPGVTLSNPVAIAAGDRVQVEARQVTNATAGVHTLAIHTSVDATDANASYSLVAPAAPSSLGVGLSSPAAGATGVRYTVRFTTSGNGGLAANAGTLRVAAPAGTVLPGSGAQYELTDLETGTFKSSLPVTLTGGGTIATVTTGFEFPAGHRARLVISNVTNAAAGSQTLGVSTSSDTTVANPGYSLVAPKQLAGLQARRSSSTPGATNVIYRIQLIPSSTGGLAGRAAGSKIVLNAPAGTAFPSAAGNYQLVDLTTDAANGTPSVTLSNSGATATIVPGGDIPAGDLVQITIGGVTNPASGTALHATSSADRVDRSTTFGALPSASLGAPSLRLAPNASSTFSRYAVDFTTAQSLIAGSSEITLTAPIHTTFPSDGCQYFIEDQTLGAMVPCPTVSLTGGDGETVNITVPFDANAGDRIFIRIQQVLNSDATGAQHLSISDTSGTAPFTLAARSALGSLRLRPTSPAEDASGVRWDVSFVTPSSGAMILGTPSFIVFTPPPNTGLPSDPANYAVTDTTTHQVAAVQSVTATGPSVEIVLGGDGLGTINGGDSMLVRIDDVGNTDATGSQTASVATSSSTGASTSLTLTALKSVSDPTVRLSNTAPGATGVTYTVHFRTSASGGLVGKHATIILSAPVNFPNGCTAYRITDTTTLAAGCVSAVTDVTGPSTVLVAPTPDVGPLDDVVVRITGLTNSSTPGSHSVTISTSSDGIGAKAPFTLG